MSLSVDQSILVTKFSDDTTMEGGIENADETAYRDDIQRMFGWCVDNNLDLNVSKTKEMIVDFRRKKTPIHTLLLNGEEVEQHHKKAQQRLYFPRQIRRFGITQEIMIRFYRATIESMLTFSIIVWPPRSGRETAARTHYEGHIQNNWERVPIHIVYLPCSMRA